MIWYRFLPYQVPQTHTHLAKLIQGIPKQNIEQKQQDNFSSTDMALHLKSDKKKALTILILGQGLGFRV